MATAYVTEIGVAGTGVFSPKSSVAITVAGTADDEGLTPTTPRTVIVTTDTACHVSISGDATTDDALLMAGQVMFLSLGVGEVVSVIEASGISGSVGAHTHTLSDITDAGTAAAADTGTGAGDVPVYDGNGLLQIGGTAYATVATLTDGANIAWNGRTQQKAQVTIAGSRTMDAMSNPVDGATYTLWVVQGSGGSHTITWTGSGAGSYQFGTDGAPTLSTTEGDVDILSFEARDIGGTVYLCFLGIKTGF